MKTNLKKLGYWSSVIMIGIVVGLALQFAKAWTEPSSAPPTANVGAPINTGSAGQNKIGPLSVQGLLWGTNAIFDGSVQIGTDTADCISAKAGSLRYAGDNNLEMCNGTAWRPIQTQAPTCTPTCTTGPGCKTNLANASVVSGTCCSGSCYSCNSGYTWNGSACVAACTPVNSEWSSWSSWSATSAWSGCSAFCGGTQTQYQVRSRTCNNAQACGGVNNCTGASAETQLASQSCDAADCTCSCTIPYPSVYGGVGTTVNICNISTYVRPVHATKDCNKEITYVCTHSGWQLLSDSGCLEDYGGVGGG